jgi:hypothetical protein
MTTTISETLPAGARWRGLLAGVALTAMAGLLVELALTRLFSVLLYYHFAFMAISVALLGLGAGGLSSYWIVGERRLPDLWPRLAALAALNAVAIVAVLAVALRLQIPVTALTRQTLLPLAGLYFACAAPFFLSGVILSVVLARTAGAAGTVYFADLTGAGLGALLLVPALNLFGGPNTLLLAAALAAASAAVWVWLGNGDARRWAILPALLLAAIPINTRWPFLDVEAAKGARLDQEVYHRWNSFSRVGLSRQSDGLWIRIDADAATPVATTPLEDRSFWNVERTQNGAGLAHTLRAGKTLIIGPGGGYDVARALDGGSRDVTGVEINPIIIRDIMLGRALQASHRLYQRPEVTIVVEDGRSYIRRSRERFDVIQATLVDTWASTAAGAFALTENNLYTVDAFREYLRHLTPTGILSITRWEFAEPREALRLVSLGLAALREEGARQPAGHFVVVADGPLSQGGAPTTVLLKRSPFTAEELETVRVTLRGTRYMTPLYLPHQRLDTPFDALLHAPDPAAYQRRYAYDISPVDDNRPFFFFNVRTRDLFNYFRHQQAMDFKVNLGLLMLLTLAGAAAAGVALLLLLPARLSARLPRAPGVARWLLYFCAIGLAYILVEIAFIQKFVLFLGHPTYALTVAVFALLVTSGMGSFWTRTRADAGLASRLALWLLAAAAWIAALAALVTPLLTRLVGLPLAGRMAVAVLLLAPAGFLMGTALPAGLRLAGRIHQGCLQWAWAMNAAASVLGSLAAVLVSIHWGIWQTMAVGAACYLAAAFLARFPTGQ